MIDFNASGFWLKCGCRESLKTREVVSYETQKLDSSRGLLPTLEIPFASFDFLYQGTELSLWATRC